jgi:CheY-like chemotaxis protein
MFMPGMNGLHLAKVIKTDPQLASIRLILLNPLGNRVDAETARRAGIAAHLTKPIRYHQLHQCLLNVMSRSQTIHPTSPHQEPEQKPKGPALRLLLAEDNVVNQKVAIRMLETLGYQVDVAANGLEAVKAVTQTPYAGILMDCQMPEMDGFEATVAIRKQEGSSSSLPIIAMTANAMQNDRENCLAVGMNAFLSKPVKLQDLKSILEKWIPQGSWTDQSQGITQAAEPAPLTPSPKTVLSGQSSLPPLDLTTLADLRQLGGENDPGFVATVVEQFLQDSEIHVTGIQHAIEENNGDSLRKVAHALKGCSRIIGANPLSEIAFQLEEMGQTSNLAEAESAFKALRSEFERVQAALQAELSPPSPAIP